MAQIQTHPDSVVTPSERPGTPDHEGPAIDAVVRLVDLHKSFGANLVLSGLDIDFPRGQTTVVLGPSGCGKSVMLKHIIGLLKPDSGEVWFENERVDELDERQLGPIRRRFGYLFQQGALFDSISVLDNIAFPLVEHTKLNAKQRQQRAREILDLVGLADFAGQMPADLSGGQRKRVALARAIVLEPEVILYDEPTTGLDPIRAGVINELIIKLTGDLHATSIVVTHDLTSAFAIADEMVMLHEGKVILRGPPEEFRNSDVAQVRRFMTGESRHPATDAIATAAGELGELHSFIAGAPGAAKDEAAGAAKSNSAGGRGATRSRH